MGKESKWSFHVMVQGNITRNEKLIFTMTMMREEWRPYIDTWFYPVE